MAKLVLKKEPTALTTLDKKPLNAAIDKLAKAYERQDELKAQIKALQAEMPDTKAIEAEILEMAPLFYASLKNPDAVVLIESNKNAFEIGKAGVKREIIDKEFIFTKLKKKAFLESCTFPLSAVDNYLTPEEKEKCLSIERTGRNFKFLGKPEKAKLK